MDLTVLGPAVGVVVSGGVAYLLAAKRMSGKIGTSDAGELWKESGVMRQDYRTRITELNGVVATLEARVDRVEEMNSVLSRENFQLTEKVSVLEKLVESLRGTITNLEAIIAAQKVKLGE